MDVASMNLTEVQQEAVQIVDGPLLVIAGAGSGKTRVVTCRIAWMIEQGIPPWQILAITFTNKAAGEMKDRIRTMIPGDEVFAGTFHGFCARVLRGNIQHLGYKEGFTIFDSGDQKSLMKRVLTQLNLDSTHYPPRGMVYQVSKLKNQMIDPVAFEGSATGYQERNLSRIYTAYQMALMENNAVDFDDLLGLTERLYRECPDVLERYQDQYRYILMDEYQDTNVAQFRILHQLASRYKNICVTGDPDQSIYSWRGATIQNIIDFTTHYPEAQVIKLEQNFRSTKTILNAANCIIQNNEQRTEKNLWTENPQGELIEVVHCSDGRAEAKEVIRRVKALRDKGESLGECAVFYRVNAISRHLEMALMDAEIPYEIVGGLPFFERKEIKDVLAYLRILFNPEDSVSLERIINVPPRSIGKTTLDHVHHYASSQRCSMLQAVAESDRITTLKARAKKSLSTFTSLLQRLRECDMQSVSACIEKVLTETDYETYLGATQKADEDRVANLRQLMQAASEYDNTTEDGSLADFLEKVALISEVDAWEDSGDRICLMSLHAAKGLEFNHVHIVGMEQGLLPHSRSEEDPKEKEEERRLLYVGMTRAKKTLTMTSASVRHLWGPGEQSMPSEFFDELPEAMLKVDDRSVAAFQSYRPSNNTKDDNTFYETQDEPTQSYYKGSLVRHKVFGLGRIISSAGSGPNMRVKVKFNAGGEKDLIAAYAKLEVCD